MALNKFLFNKPACGHMIPFCTYIGCSLRRERTGRSQNSQHSYIPSGTPSTHTTSPRLFSVRHRHPITLTADPIFIEPHDTLNASRRCARRTGKLWVQLLPAPARLNRSTPRKPTPSRYLPQIFLPSTRNKSKYSISSYLRAFRFRFRARER